MVLFLIGDIACHSVQPGRANGESRTMQIAFLLMYHEPTRKMISSTPASDRQDCAWILKTPANGHGHRFRQFVLKTRPVYGQFHRDNHEAGDAILHR